MSLSSKNVAIDLGSSHTRVYLAKKGLVTNQPTVLARDEIENKMVAIGDQALEMQGKSSDSISIIRPLQSGAIADFGSTKYLIKRFLQESIGRWQLSKPEGMMTVSSTATSTEKRALLDAGKEAGLQNVHLIRSATAAALGAGLPITEPRANFIIDIGSGTTEIGVFSLGGQVSGLAIRLGGSAIDEGLRRGLRREYGMSVGQEEIERIKRDFIDLEGDINKTFAIDGRSTIQGTPKTTNIKRSTIQPYIEPVFEKMTLAVRKVMERTPPELISDVIKHGVILSGGTSQTQNLPSFFSKRLNAAFILADEPMLACIKGANLALSHLDEYKRASVG